MPKLKLAKVGALTTNDYHRFKVIEKGRTNGCALFLLACSCKISPFSSMYVI